MELGQRDADEFNLRRDRSIIPTATCNAAHVSSGTPFPGAALPLRFARNAHDDTVTENIESPIEWRNKIQREERLGKVWRRMWNGQNRPACPLVVS